VGGRFIIDMYDLLMEWTELWNVPRNGLVRGTACRQALHQKRAPRDSPHLKVDTVVRSLHRQYVSHDPKTDGIQWSRLRDLCASTQSERTDRETCANVQPFSQEFRTPTVAKEFQIGLYDPAETDLEHIWNCCSAGFLLQNAQFWPIRTETRTQGVLSVSNLTFLFFP